jgi:hypothetical protein
MPDVELCLLQDACRFYTDTCIKVHSKPILIPLLYQTRGGTLKMLSQQVLHIIMTYANDDAPPQSMLMMMRHHSLC